MYMEPHDESMNSYHSSHDFTLVMSSQVVPWAVKIVQKQLPSRFSRCTRCFHHAKINY